MARVEVKVAKIFASNECVRTKLGNVVGVQIEISDVHWNAAWHFGVAVGATVYDVRTPRLVIETRAVVRARHLTVAGIKFTAVTQGKTV